MTTRCQFCTEASFLSEGKIESSSDSSSERARRTQNGHRARGHVTDLLSSSVDLNLDHEGFDVEIASTAALSRQGQREGNVLDADRFEIGFLSVRVLSFRRVGRVRTLIHRGNESQILLFQRQMNERGLNVGGVQQARLVEKDLAHLIVVHCRHETIAQQVENRLGRVFDVVNVPFDHEQLIPQVESRVRIENADEHLRDRHRYALESPHDGLTSPIHLRRKITGSDMRSREN